MTHPDLTRLLGPPGTGKTSNLVGLPPGVPNPSGLVGVVEQELASGTRPNRIAYLAFTKKASIEGIERACQRFGFHFDAAKGKSDDLPFFSTIHSLTFRQLGLKPDRVVQGSHYRELGDKLGVDLRPRRATDDAWYGMDTGDRMVFLEGFARVCGRPLRNVWEDANEENIDYWQLEQYSRALAAYKASRGLLDYTDMLGQFVQHAATTVPPLDCLIVDEAQDLSPMQWAVVEAIAARAKRVYIAGDDDQAIYRWAGADVDTFIGLQGKTRVLGESFRVPSSVHEIAYRIVRRVVKRTQKAWKPRTEKGVVRWYGTPDEVDLSKGSWLLLARNGYLLQPLEELCSRQGFSFISAGRSPLESKALQAVITYTRLCKGKEATQSEVEQVLKWMTLKHCGQGVRSGLRAHDKAQPVTMGMLQGWGFHQNPPIWHVMLDKVPEQDRTFFIAALRRGEKLTKAPRIKVSTIHAAKGGEADNVLLLTDMSQRTYLEMERRMDDEMRVWYVAVTRAINGLHLIQPNTGNAFEI